MEECVKKGVKFAHLLTAGFSETGRPEHAELESELVQIARKGTIRIVGPNCMGLYTPEGGLAFNEGFPIQPGSISLFSQSGQLASHFVHEGHSRQGLTYNKVVSFGNASDLQAHDFLDYFYRDEKTEVIGSYLEGVKHGRLFFETARRATRKKALVIWKGGQTEGGSRATQSHTAAIAGPLNVWQAMCRQAGIIQVHSITEAITTVAALKRMILPKGVRVAIMGGAGGGSVTMTDMAEKNGLKVPHLSEKTIKTLEEFVPVAGNSVKNPLDVFFNNDNHFKRLIQLLKEDPNIDAFIYNMRFGGPNQFRGLFELNRSVQSIIDASEALGKPMAIVLEPTGETEIDMLNKEIASSLHTRNVATFPSFEIAAKVIANLKGYHDYLLSS
jgi:acyl-CoA synthetase (NDP forming)